MGANRRGQGGDRKAPLSPPQRRNPLLPEKSRYVRKNNYAVAPIWRDTAWLVERAAWGRVCGRAKILAGTLRCLRLLLDAFDMLVARGTVGALPQTPAGTLSLDPARGRRKGTKSPLDPFFVARLGRFSLPLGLSGFFICPFHAPGRRRKSPNLHRPHSRSRADDPSGNSASARHGQSLPHHPS